MKKKYELLLLDAANTIIHKPDLYVQILKVLERNNIIVDVRDIKRNHKLLSEIIHFPDRTSAVFYQDFNRELLLSLGIIPTDELLNNIFKACSYLPWAKFEDADVLNELEIKKAVLSNFKNTLDAELSNLFGNIFDFVITSESKGMGKPRTEFYQLVIDQVNIAPEKILYIGDSLKLDMIPANRLGFDTLLIDRDNIFKYNSNKIDSLQQLKALIN